MEFLRKNTEKKNFSERTALSTTNGSTAFIKNPKSDFGDGFKYIMLNFFYKDKQGIVVQAILFNNLNFVQNKTFMEIFHSFKFHE
ncbi:MAG: hypothetical protein Pg6A_12080 [Termitinemataceae bacterium]|nr:MAG: hypothetical protein Pg6A_12080 [Termitinemataceae bacterium]